MSEIKINSQGEVKLFDSDNSNYIGLKAPGTVSSDQTFILPDADGSANNALKTDGSGNLGFVDVTTLVTSAIDWQSTLKTGDFTAVSGEGYFINTTSGAITATLPASPSAGNIVAFKDYAATFATNNLTIGRNSSNIQGNANDSVLSTNRASVVLVYVDATKGWLYVQESNVQFLGPLYVTATGGTITTSGDYKIHTFTGSGTFTVSCAGNSDGSTSVDYMIVAGGGGGGSNNGGGGAGGGWRATAGTASGSYSAGPGPLTSPVSAVTVSASPGSYPITVGAGGNGASGPSSTASSGGVSVFNSVTSTGGGYGGGAGSGNPGATGGSGGGGAYNGNGAAGNTPPVSPPQGNNGGNGSGLGGGGGGGATAVGSAGCSANGGPGATGSTSLISASPVGYSGGAGGGSDGSTGGSASSCGSGGRGGDHATSPANNTAGATNRGGGGGGGGGAASPSTGKNGGSGVVVIRYKYQN
jgi:hypothetical protein